MGSNPSVAKTNQEVANRLLAEIKAFNDDQIPRDSIRYQLFLMNVLNIIGFDDFYRNVKPEKLEEFIKESNA